MLIFASPFDLLFSKSFLTAQVASLRDTLTKKDEEIERLQMLKDLRTQHPNLSNEKRGRSSVKHAPSSPNRAILGAHFHHSRKMSSGRSFRSIDKAASDQDNCSEYSDKQSETGSHQSLDDFRQRKDFLRPSKLAIRDSSQNFLEDAELLAFGDGGSEERLSDISDSGLSMGTETDGSMCSIVEFTLFPEAVKPGESTEKM